MYLVSLIGIYPHETGDYTVRMYSKQQTAKGEFIKMTKQVMNYYKKENIHYSIEQSDNYCHLLARNGDSIDMFIQDIQPDGVIHSSML